MISRRRLLASVTVLPGAALATSADARKRKQKPKPKPKFQVKTVTRTFTSNDFIVTPDLLGGPASVYPSKIKVQGLTQGRIQRVTVTLTNFSVKFPNELDILLAAPNGKATILMSDVGGAWPDVVPPAASVTFDDAASGNVPTPLVGGTFRPTNVTTFFGDSDPFPPPAPTGITSASLGTFKGGNPNGMWSLFIVDDSLEDGGSIGGWSLKITARIRVRVKSKPKKRSQRAA